MTLDLTTREHARLSAEREQLTGAQNDRIDALEKRIDSIAKEVARQRELLEAAVRGGRI